MSPQEPTPQDDDQTILVGIVAKAMHAHWIGDKSPLDYGSEAKAVLEALKSAGYELVNQVGTIGPVKRTVKNLGGSLMGDIFEEAADTPETIARWIGERESTHLWPEIREDDKACYRDAARHLLATISYSDYCPRS